jgi:hypothetical protein
MKRRWFEILMGLAAINPSPITAAALSPLSAAPAVPLASKPQPTFHINKLTTSIDGAIASRPQVLSRGPAENKLFFDASDSRRGLDDWALEDYVLVATIEGHLYALDRYSGATKWVLEGDGAAVRSVRTKYDANITEENAWTNKDAQPRWIVQPVEGGQLFLFDPEFGVLVSTFF